MVVAVWSPSEPVCHLRGESIGRGLPVVVGHGSWPSSSGKPNRTAASRAADCAIPGSAKDDMSNDINRRLATLGALLELTEAVAQDDLKAVQACRDRRLILPVGLFIGDRKLHDGLQQLFDESGRWVRGSGSAYKVREALKRAIPLIRSSKGPQQSASHHARARSCYRLATSIATDYGRV